MSHASTIAVLSAILYQHKAQYLSHQKLFTRSFDLAVCKMRRQAVLALVLGLSSLTSAVEYCAPAGIPLLPLPDLSIAPAFDKEPLTAALDLLNTESLLFNTSSTSYSVTITTKEDTIFEYHYTAPNINTTVGVSEVDGDTIYRIFSVTKLFVVLSALLQEGLNMDDPVWKYVPQLEGVDSFENTTLRMLASHLSGAVRDGMSIAGTIIPK
jgi:hypothetical protein